MRVLLIRHAKAQARSLFGLSQKKDAARALTDVGRRQMRKAAAGLHTLVPGIDLLAASPLVRAQQTAQIVARTFKLDDIVEQALLAPGGEPAALLEWLRAQPRASTIALVGHEPDLSQFAGFLLTGVSQSLVVFKKGGCALIEFDGKPEVGRGCLVWLMQSSAMRELA